MAFANERTHILSTEGMIDHARRADTPERYRVATETGILYGLRRQVPDAVFEPVREDAVCRYMKMITLEKLRDSLRDLRYEVRVPDEMAARALGINVATVVLVVAHVLVALRSVRAPMAVYRSLVKAPAYVAWKVRVWVESLVRSNRVDWTRTRRNAERM